LVGLLFNYVFGYCQELKIKKALKISQAPFEAGSPVVSLPFYAIEGFLKQEE